MPSAYDLQQLTVTHDPVQRLDFNFGKLPGLDPALIIAQWTQFVEDYLFPIIEELTGIDLSALTNLIEAISEAIGIGDLTQILPQLLGAFSGIDITNPGSILTAIVAALGVLITNLLTGQQPINALGIFGSLLPSLFSNVPIGALNSSRPNMFTLGDFPTAAVLDGGDVWTWDAAVGRTANGSARVEASGVLKGLTRKPIPVAEGQPIELQAWARWVDLVYTGAPIQLSIRKFEPGDAPNTWRPIGVELIDTIAAPGADSADHADEVGGWVELSGEWTVDEGVSAYVPRLLVTNTATAGTVWFDDGRGEQTGQILQEWVQNLVADLQALLEWVENLVDNLLSAIGLDPLGDLLDKIFDLADGLDDWFGDSQLSFGQISDLGGRFGDLIDNLFEGLQGGVPSLSGLDDLIDAIKDAFQNIPFLNILGIGGPGNIGGSLQETWDQLIGGLVGAVGSGSGLADIFNVAQDIASRATLGLFSWDILGIRSNKSLNTGLLSTSESNISFDKVALAAAPPTFALTQSTAITAYQRISESALKGAVSWLGEGVTNITHAFVNIYKMDPATGDETLVHASANIVGNLSSSMQYNIYEIPDPIQVEPGEVYGIEVAVRGAGTHDVVGSSTWLPNHPSVFPRALSSVRDSGTSAPPSTIDSGDVDYTTNVPFIEFAVTAGDAAIPRTAETTLFNTPGDSSIPIPSWANYVDVVVVGGGGGGRQGGTWGVSGEGGDEGLWETDTWARGTEFTGTPSIDVSIAAAAIGGTGNGANGGTCSAAITGHSVSATGGEGGDALGAIGDDKNGKSPGDITYNDVLYRGGGVQNSFGGDGAAPGGGGAGGNYVSFQSGGDGAPGAVWLRFYQ